MDKLQVLSDKFDLLGKYQKVEFMEVWPDIYCVTDTMMDTAIWFCDDLINRPNRDEKLEYLCKVEEES